MRKLLIFNIACLLTLATAVMAASKSFTLVIDAGHGGNDAGAVGAISKEKDINLSVALAFGKMVEENCPDVKVVYTRKTDVFIPLLDRAEIANRNKADLFISIHTNALPKKAKKVSGMETYTLGMHRAADNLEVAMRENSVITYEKDYKERYQGFDPKSSESYILFEFLQDKNMEQSVELARAVQKRTCARAGRNNMGVKQAGFLVLRETSMPSCLIELGFISTPAEEQFLNTKDGQRRLSEGIYNAFLDYKTKYHKGGLPAAQPAPQETQEALSSQSSQSTPSSQIAPSSPNTQSTPISQETPVFKVQIGTSSKLLDNPSATFKGIENIESYQEGGTYKYTVGASTDYNEIYRLRKEIAQKIPEAFIIAFRGDEKMDVREAIKIFKEQKQ